MQALTADVRNRIVTLVKAILKQNAMIVQVDRTRGWWMSD